MKIQFSRDYGTIEVQIDEQDYEHDSSKCRILEKLYNSEEWIALLELMAIAESKLDEAVMKVKPSEQSFREGAIYAARKNGFCEAMKLLGKTVESFKQVRANRKKAVESQVDEILGQLPQEVNYSGE